MPMTSSAVPGATEGLDQSARVLVFGATGYIGAHLVPRLLREGCAVRASGRNRKVLEARDWPGAEMVEADALQPESLPGVLAGVDTAYYLVHSMAAGQDFGHLDLQAAENFAAAANQAGVRRIVYLGGLVPDDADSEHLVSRRETGNRLRARRVPVTEIRAGIIVGPGSAAYEVIRDLVNHLPLMLTPRWVRSKSSPIALDNLVEYLVRVAWLDEAAGKVLDAGGPQDRGDRRRADGQVDLGLPAELARAAQRLGRELAVGEVHQHVGAGIAQLQDLRVDGRVGGFTRMGTEARRRPRSAACTMVSSV